MLLRRLNIRQIIRENTFETNSSSMHSLVITKKARPYKEYEKCLEYYGHEKEFELFGCCDTHIFERTPYEVLSSPKDKLRYYVAHYIGFKKDKSKIKEVKEFIHKVTGCPTNTIILTYVDDDHWYKKGVKPTRSYGWAGINDTGEDVFDYIERNKISLEEFILDPRYTVIVDGDEYQEFKKLFLKGIINIDNIEYISSGKSFWLDDIKTFSLYFINRLNKDEVFNDLMENLSDYADDEIKFINIEDEEEDIIPSALEVFVTVLQCLKTLTNASIKLVLKNHNKKDYKQILKFIDIIEKV